MHGTILRFTLLKLGMRTGKQLQVRFSLKFSIKFLALLAYVLLHFE